MGLFDWFKRRSDTPKPSVEMVPYFDTEAKRVVRIPASELRPGVVQARVQGIDELVWISPEQLHPGELRHPPFDEDVRAYIRQIHEAFAEQRPLSFDEWEDGFRRDGHPEREIALWVHAANVYSAFTASERSAERRADVYRIIVAAMTAPRDKIWHVLKLSAMSRDEAEPVIRRIYGGENG
jgi:hypothetical protein